MTSIISAVLWNELSSNKFRHINVTRNNLYYVALKRDFFN